MDRLSDLPEPVLYRILYFLKHKEGARTCVLSKSLRYIWSNRHQLHLRLREPIIRKNKKTKVDFMFEADKTLQSLLDQNHQGVQKLHLRISNLNSQSLAFLRKWLPMLKPMSIKCLNLYIILPPTKEEEDRVNVDLPLEAFVAAKSLHSLHMWRCNLLSLSDHKKQQLVDIPFKYSLGILCLHHVSVQQSIVDKILSSCINLTTIRFEQCQGLTGVNITNNQNLWHFTFIAHHSYTFRDCKIRITAHLPDIQKIRIVGSRVLLRSREYSKLKSLSLTKVAILSDSFDRSSSCSFPSLRDLTLAYSSVGGLTCIDAPNMVTFKYEGTRVPTTLSFTTTTTTPTSTCPPRSDINLLPRGGAPPQSWFLDLSKFLRSLSHSEINLNLTIRNLPVDDHEINSNVDKPVVVESLRLGGHVPTRALLDGLFRICRPRYISHNRHTPDDDVLMNNEQKELNDFLCTTLFLNNANQQEEEEEGILLLRPSDVKFQTSLDRDGREWQFTDQNSLASSIYTQTRFVLNWTQHQ